MSSSFNDCSIQNDHSGSGARLPHGGALHAAARRYRIPLTQWLDLSTGINPHGWPVPDVPEQVWQRLPEDEDGLEETARGYYGAGHVLPVAGSQAAIQALPRLRRPGRVSVVHPCYAEHAAAWRSAGHAVTEVAADRISAMLPSTDVLVLANPNNPDGRGFAGEQLLGWHAQLAAEGGWLVVDEAFMDPTPGASLAACTDCSGLLVLRSLGKFFGLAGARVGFVCGEPTLLERLAFALGPWSVSTPARWVAQRALADTAWQAATMETLPREAERLANMLATSGLTPTGGTALFQWVAEPRAGSIHRQLARQGILTRHWQDPEGLRFGLPADETAWQRLARALAVVR